MYVRKLILQVLRHSCVSFQNYVKYINNIMYVCINVLLLLSYSVHIN